MMKADVSQREIWTFMKVYADQLAEYLQPQNCVPNPVLNGPMKRLNDLAKLFDYATALAQMPSYRNVEIRDVSIELDQGEVYTLMKAAAKSLVVQLESQPFRCDTGTAIKRLNELQAVMPPYKAPSSSDEG
jgi:hypothetical protein